VISITPKLAQKYVRQFKGLIFDLDGTLFDSKNIAQHLIAARPFDALTLWCERRARKRLHGCDFGTPALYYDALFSTMSELTGRKSAAMRDWFFKRYMPSFCDVLRKYYRPRPGASELLKTIAALMPGKLAVYSDYPNVWQRLNALGIDAEPFGDNVYSPDDFGAQKPAARPFIEIAQRLDVQPRDMLVFGDRDDTDGAGAMSADMSYIRIEGGKKQKEESPYPSLTWEEFAELVRKSAAERRWIPSVS
jgi:FMN phosphatase YigB (HAD superfamily)